MDFSYALGHEAKYEAWNLPYGISLLLVVAMLWGMLLVKEPDMRDIFARSNRNQYFALLGLLPGALGILFWAAFPFNLMVTLFLVSWVHDAGGSLGATLATGAWMVVGWWLAGWMFVAPNWNRR